MRRGIILLLFAALLTLIAAASALRPKTIEVEVEGSPPAISKLKIDIIPEDVIVGEEVEIIIKDSEGNPVEKAKVYVAKDHDPSKEATCIGETNSSGVLVHVFEDGGLHRIYVEKEGFLPQERLVNVELKGALSFSMELKEAHDDEQLKTIRITSDGKPVEGVEIHVNGTLIGYTNSDGELSYTFKLGEVYEITIRKEGYRGLLVILDMDPRGGTGSVIRPLRDGSH